MKTRILRALVVILATICIIFVVKENTDDISEVSAENVTYEVINPACKRSEEEKKQIYEEYLENLYAEDITSLRGVLGCKVDFDLSSYDDVESEITVQYFYDPNLVNDVAALEEGISNYVSALDPDAEAVNVRGTPVTYRNAVEYSVVDDQIFDTLPADLNLKWNYVPVVPD